MVIKKKSNPSPAPTAVAQDRKYRAEEDLRTLQRAAEIQRDKSRVGAAQKVAREQMQAPHKIAGAKP
jgi:hypothetical protein